MKQLADTFKALSDETRLQIMTLLLDREELCVCDFVETLGLTQSKVSRHLRYLYNAGLVDDRREGLWMHYRISRHLSPAQKMIVKALSEAIADDRKQELNHALDRWLAEKAVGRAKDRAGGKSAPCCEPMTPAASGAKRGGRS
jgi:ArsR family transcriptional regulator, arsenate/arsenite/antimonite-responsive transcriptional repressor